MIRNDELCEVCCKQHGRIFETCNGGCHIRDLFEKIMKERDAAVTDLSRTTSACDFCTGRFCEINPLDSGGCKFEWRGLSLAEKTSDKKEEEE